MLAPFIHQKLFIIDISAGTLAQLQGYLDAGYIINHVINLNPTFNKLLIIYYDPSVDPQ